MENRKPTCKLMIEVLHTEKEDCGQRSARAKRVELVGKEVKGSGKMPEEINKWRPGFQVRNTLRL